MRRKPQYTFSIYVCKLLKQVHPDTGMTTKGMSIKPSISLFFRYQYLSLSVSLSLSLFKPWR